MKKNVQFLFFLILTFFTGVKLLADSFEGPPVQGSTAMFQSEPNSNPDSIDDISIQDIFQSDVDASDKIENKVIDAVTQFSSNCNIYNKFELSLRKFVFPKSIVEINLGPLNASFYNFSIKEECDTNSNRKKYFATIGCDSSTTAKIKVTLPNIKISANIKIMERTDPSDESSFQSHVGSISIILKNNSISKQFNFQPNDSNDDENTTSKISYFKTKVFLDISTKFLKHICSNLAELLNEVELPMKQFLVNELNAELMKNNITVGQSCSKFINVEIPSRNHNLYVISNVSLETWKGADSSVGTIVIGGLSHFTSTELIVTDSGITESSSGFYDTIPNSEDPERHEIIGRVKTNGLKGKLYWNYDKRPISLSFSIDFILFEVKKSKTFRYTPGYYRNGRYTHTRSKNNEIDVNLSMGNVRTELSESSICEKEKEFVKLVLSELKTVVKDALKNSLVKKIQNNVSTVKCYY